jgi:lipopolysaccharide transport system ATP-binding protein
VAAHLEPEILVVDEVLAVGDASFQKKCLGKMEEVADQDGRTVLFVSHNMAATQSLCNYGILLERGSVKDFGDIHSIVNQYQSNSEFIKDSQNIYDLKYFRVNDLSLYSPNNTKIKTFSPVEIVIKFAGKREIAALDVYMAIKSTDGHRLVGMQLQDMQPTQSFRAGQNIEVTFSINCLPLMPGQYTLEIELKDIGMGIHEFIPKSFSLEVVEAPVYGTREANWWHGSVGLKVEVQCCGMIASEQRALIPPDLSESR